VEHFTEKWRRVGKLNGADVWQSSGGQLAIERGFELLCEFTLEEREQWQQRCRTADTFSQDRTPRRSSKMTIQSSSKACSA